MKRYQFYFWVIICLGIGPIIAQESSTDLLESAASFYADKSYDKAIEQYTKILASGKHSRAVYNNLGSAYYKQGDIPKSILYYEKGLKQNPFDDSLLHNLSLSKEQLDSDIVQIPEFIFTKAWKFMHTRLSSNSWFVLCFLCLLGAVYGFKIWLLHSTRSTKKRGFLSGVTLLAVSILLFSLSLSQASFQNTHNTAIIIPEPIVLKSAPEEANEPIMTLEPGTKILLLDQIGSYYKVRLDNGQLGWVANGSFELI